MAPFIAATALTYYLVGTLQDMAVRCTSQIIAPFSLVLTLTDFAADAYANDPKNPYAAQIAKEKAAAHH